MKLAVNLWTVYGWDLPEMVSTDVLRALAQMGASGVELIVDDQFNSPEALLAREQKINDLLKRVGLQVPGVATTLFWRYNLASQDEDLRQRGLELIREGCCVARAFNASCLLILAGQQEAGIEYARSYEIAVASVRQGAAYAADLGIILAVENVRGNFLCSPGEYARFLADVGHPSVQAYLDFGNGMSVGPSYPDNWIAAVRGRIVAVHAKGYDKYLDAYVCCGLGDVPWERTFSALRDVKTPPRGYGKGRPSREAGLHAARTSLQWLARFV